MLFFLYVICDGLVVVLLFGYLHSRVFAHGAMGRRIDLSW